MASDDESLRARVPKQKGQHRGPQRPLKPIDANTNDDSTEQEAEPIKAEPIEAEHTEVEPNANNDETIGHIPNREGMDDRERPQKEAPE
jgi:hypothetical protein